MIKKLITFTILITVMSISLPKVQAARGNPFDALWVAIAELRQQINNLELTAGPPGPQGPQGEPGPAGSPGLLNTYRVTSPIVFVNLGSTASTTAQCQPGDQIVSGGFFANGSTLQITQSRPELTAVQGWYVEGSTANPPAGTLPGIGDIAAYALCNDVTP